MDHRIPGQSPGVSPVSVHFVNNVLAAAASYIEEDPDAARDVLELLGRGHLARPAQAVGEESTELGQHVARGVRILFDVARGCGQHVIDEMNGDG